MMQPTYPPTSYPWHPPTKSHTSFSGSSPTYPPSNEDMAEVQPASSAGPGDSSPTAISGSASNAKMRKRTKTGCLTCRKRRIKCGEERPTCANCIKSKRQCEGYNQRVIFKPPIGDWPNHPGVVSTIQYHTSMLPGTRNQTYRGPEPSAPMQENMLASIQPRPLGDFNFSQVDPNAGPVSSGPHQTFVGGNPGYTHDQPYQQPLQSPPHHQPLASPHNQPQSHTSPASYFPPPPVVHTSPPAQFSQSSSSYQAPFQYTQGPSYPPVSVPYNSTADLKPTGSQPLPRQPIYQPPYRSDSLQEGESSYRDQPSASPPSNEYPQYTEARPGVQRYNSHPQVPMQPSLHSSGNISQAGNYSVPHTDYSHSSYSTIQVPVHDINQDVKYMPQPVLDPTGPTSQSQKCQPHLNLSGFGGNDHVSPTQVLDEAAVEFEDDDYWDVQSDEDMFDAEPGDDENAVLASKEFNNIRRIHLENFNELGIRRYDAFLYDGLLTHYRPEYAANPLRNPKTARVFAHYIHVTGPTISIFDRNSRNPTLIFEGETPPAQQGLWTHTLPLKALSHQGLLHAMLALASLHIARLQGASITPSYKHYAYSLKRLVRSLGHPKKRLSILTLATSLLLACYEVWTAEHVKWGTHLIGAQRLIDELDFRSLTREARRLRAAQTAMMRQFPYQNPEMLIDQKHFNQRLKENVVMPDERLVSTIVGKKVSYDDFGMVFEDNGARHDTRPKIPEKLDLQTYETLQDLCWAFSRHDVYQSIVSGHRLINPYRKWSDCPPRAPIGQIDAVYGTHDHIVLLLARVADFTVRDRERKLRQAEADGGWRPRPGMPGFGNMGPPPTQKATPGPPTQAQGPPRPDWTGQHPTGPSSQGRPAPPVAPSFYGMAPSPGMAPIHSSYENPNFQRSPPTPNTPHPKYVDLPAAYEHAVLEWQSIVDAHTKVSELLEQADGFGPLPEDILPPAPGGQDQGLSVPFGPPILYRSYDISIIWMMLHLSKIILLRSHPGMPAAATMAAGVCASAATPYGMLIGRIAVGMQIPVTPDLSPFLGAVLTESSMPLFFAGITFQDAKQREWLITRFLEIDKRTGWASAGIIARGCETAWEKTAEMGRGPPYIRRTNPITKDEDGRYTDQQEDSTIRRERNRVQERQTREQETRFVVKSGVTGTWAVNLLGTEEDLRMGMERFGL
ncbi:hypothetical protein PTNB73_02697 [Pyrenophora teres f. teres]|uniref:Transcription factor Cys6 like protein n=1 Tax=Pyrenophora teres f. teres TaxID=97479 RepID=A0A6S6W2K5_9PLEO|nr:hypothetical protein HRS9122_09663 [Pyrenophora teres f. teres]KAE8839286.1 hypothetical protein HRS9139_03669 [Pyrenophora teres f. teres]KAE8845250.1 hypothetical protein PTNB85_03515 [Pyrenophora teres f. teres]KAE8865603.1 hypothetical protein PTNB29_02750 [Pyrenophora teres f. teres]KAE8871238.1 hypothetical protein PTNB73_02697 [Pyrenophora teres f. teres]